MSTRVLDRRWNGIRLQEMLFFGQRVESQPIRKDPFTVTENQVTAIQNLWPGDKKTAGTDPASCSFVEIQFQFHTVWIHQKDLPDVCCRDVCGLVIPTCIFQLFASLIEPSGFKCNMIDWVFNSF